MEKGTVINRLIGWTKWKLNHTAGIGWPKASSFTRLMVDESRSNHNYDDADIWCIETNDAVEGLPYFQHMIIRMEYLSNVREMKLKLELIGVKNKKTYYQYLNQAYEMVGDFIEAKYKVEKPQTITMHSVQ